MEHRLVGRSGLRVSRLGLGTMTWGRDTGEDDAAEQLEAFVDVGGSLLDTADVYGDGASEQVVGRLVGPIVPRESVVVATKAFGRTSPGPMGRGASRGHLLAALEASLRRLEMDYVDLWQVHSWDPEVPLEETLSALTAAVETGKARYVGVSNYTGWQLATACASRPGLLVSSQVEYSLLQRGIEREALPAARHHGAGVLAWSPLGRGVLTGKYRSGIPADSRAASPDWERFVAPYLSERAAAVVEATVTAADGLGVSPIAVALAWVRDQAGVASALVGSRTVGQLRGALAADDLVLPQEIRAALDDVSEPAFGYPERWP